MDARRSPIVAGTMVKVSTVSRQDDENMNARTST